MSFAILIGSLGRRSAWRAEASPSSEERSSLIAEIRGVARPVARQRRLVWTLGPHGVWNFALGAALTLGLAMIVDGELDGGTALLGYATGAYGMGNVLSNVILAGSEIGNTMGRLHFDASVADVWVGAGIRRHPGTRMVVRDCDLGIGP
jgi:hypothetical protein